MLDFDAWAKMPFHFYSLMFFVLGSMVGSFLNVCIYRMPLGLSVVKPASHCPSCNTPIRWYHNLPLISWLSLRGRCAYCGASFSARYFLVELLTACVFLCCWLVHGPYSAAVALMYALFLSGLIAATFIDHEHMIIPDEITLGGIGVGFLGAFVVPEMHHVKDSLAAAQQAFWGALAGGGVIYLFLRIGKMMLGRQKVVIPPGTRVYFGESTLLLPGEEIPYDYLFYRPDDVIELQATRVELPDRCLWNQRVRVDKERVRLGDAELSFAEVPCMEVETELILLPREAMGLGDAKFMGAIGAFLGWGGALFSLMASALVGSVVGVTLIALKKRDRSSPMPYGPYLAGAAAVWTFFGDKILKAWLGP